MNCDQERKLVEDQTIEFAIDLNSFDLEEKVKRVSICDIYDIDSTDPLLLKENVNSNVEDYLSHENQLNMLAHSDLPECVLVEDVGDDDVYAKEYLIDPSPLRPERFRTWLQGYDKFEKSELMFNLEKGIRVPSSAKCDDSAPIPQNHQSVFSFQESVEKKLNLTFRRGGSRAHLIQNQRI